MTTTTVMRFDLTLSYCDINLPALRGWYWVDKDGRSVGPSFAVRNDAIRWGDKYRTACEMCE